MVSKRYSKANNPLLPDYDGNKLHKAIAYLAANDIYGWPMEQAAATKRVHLEAGAAQGGRSFKGGPGVPRRASRGAQQLFTYGTREKRVEKLFRISCSASARLAAEREGAFHGAARDVDALVRIMDQNLKNKFVRKREWFRTAGEVITFLAKNTWLLILAMVAFLIERVTKRVQPQKWLDINQQMSQILFLSCAVGSWPCRGRCT